MRAWQKRMRGVASVVTGGGKTVFAFLCMNEFWESHEDGRVVILVPTLTLLDQWFVGLQEDFGIPEEDIACFSSQEKAAGPRAVNILVLNTGRKLVGRLSKGHSVFLVVDECHRAGSPENAKALQGRFRAALGLSATPEREYDRGFETLVVPALGPVIFEYGYTEASADGVVTSFSLVNVEVDLLPDEREAYDLVTGRLQGLLRKARAGEVEVGVDQRLRLLLQKRAAVSTAARMRLPVSARIVEENRGLRTLVFCERVDFAEKLVEVLLSRNHSVCLFHSRMEPGLRRDNLRLFRQGVFDVLVSCRALDEGMNVPEATVAVVASSTASRRQRIQRLGRVLRPAANKRGATIYTLFATATERKRLLEESAELGGVAEVQWAAGERESSGV